MENEKLYQILAGNHPVRPELREKINGLIKKESLPKNQVLLKPGQINTRIWFIDSGSAIGYIYKDGKKIPFLFWNENAVMLSMNSFFNQVASDCFIELLEPSVLYSITADELQEILKTNPETHFYIRKIMNDYQYQSEKRIMRFTSFTPEEHYLYLLKEMPAILRKASVESISAYLGISRKTLNRIRNRTRRM